MFTYIDRQKDKLYAWFVHHVGKPQAKWWLAAISFAESIIFPLPTAAFLILVLAANAKRWLELAILTTVFSVLGGIAGYFLGAFFFDIIGAKIVDLYHLGEQMDTVQELYDGNSFLVTFTAAFTPIPYKVIVLSAGFLKVNFIGFLLGSILGRSLQFFIVAYAMKLFGPGMTKVFLKYFNAILLIVVAIVVIALLL